MFKIINRSEVCCGEVKDFGNVVREMVEVIEDIGKLNWSGIVSELGDVYGLGMCWLYDKIGVDGWVIKNKNMEKWEKRWSWWKRFCELRGIEFDGSMLSGGSNMKKWNKVYRVWKDGMDEMC